MELFYRTAGVGKPLLILHGLFGMSDNWLTIAKKLGANYRIYIPDLRNHGNSPHSDAFNYNVLSRDINDFIKMQQELLNVPLFIIGHSMGGKAAMKFALSYPQSVEKLIIIDIKPGAYNQHFEHPAIVNAMESVDLLNAKSYSDIDRMLAGQINSGRLRQFLLKNIIRKNNNVFAWKFNLEAIKNNLDCLLEGINYNEDLFNKPVLFIRGGLSDYINNEDIIDIKKSFPVSEIVTIPDATHWVHFDAPDKFLQIVNSFLS